MFYKIFDNIKNADKSIRKIVGGIEYIRSDMFIEKPARHHPASSFFMAVSKFLKVNTYMSNSVSNQLRVNLSLQL